MKKYGFFSIFLVLLFSCMTGCGSARVIEKNATCSESASSFATEVSEQSASAARSTEDFKNPKEDTAVTGGEQDPAELQKMMDEYAPFDVTYNLAREQWYFQGEKVRIFHDILISNGESLTGGNFSGSIRMLNSPDGDIDIYTVRDYSRINKDGNGTLTDIKKYSKQEFDKHTKSSLEES